MEALEQPQWRPAAHAPPGGFIAGEIKKIHDDSLSIFPESVYGGEGRKRSKGRWVTTMKDDYIPIAAMKAEADKRKGIINATALDNDLGGVSGTLGGGNGAKFQRWQIPSRATESREGAGSRASVDQMADQLEEIRLGSPTRAPSALPSIKSASPRPPTVNTPVFRPNSKRASKKNKIPKSFAAKNVMQRYHTQPRDNRTTAEKWLDQANDMDRQAILDSLQAKTQVKEEDVAEPMKNWLQSASSKEREVALTFFKSLADTQLMGGAEEKKHRVDQVIGLLENPPTTSRASLTSSQRMRGLNRLTPDTRNNRWRHQTWHKLPSYPNRNKVLNKSSILIEPHSTVHRHFTIHPDWGP